MAPRFPDHVYKSMALDMQEQKARNATAVASIVIIHWQFALPSHIRIKHAELGLASHVSGVPWVEESVNISKCPPGDLPTTALKTSDTSCILVVRAPALLPKQKKEHEAICSSQVLMVLYVRYVCRSHSLTDSLGVTRDHERHRFREMCAGPIVGDKPCDHLLPSAGSAATDGEGVESMTCKRTLDMERSCRKTSPTGAAGYVGRKQGAAELSSGQGPWTTRFAYCIWWETVTRGRCKLQWELIRNSSWTQEDAGCRIENWLLCQGGRLVPSATASPLSRGCIGSPPLVPPCQATEPTARIGCPSLPAPCT
ncbi:hypothetical protein GGR57DRAFT_298915 [Xylariaceae sp. FL1272]|nr:hypothetical protein GGR57DRAFT_298915 [Xylariaceae sp. FL1272]